MNTRVLLMAWLAIGIVAVALAGLLDDPYLAHVRDIPSPQPYPSATVLWATIFMLAQTRIALTILHPCEKPAALWRTLLLVFVGLAALLFAIGGAMHAPPAYGAYLLWLLAFLIIALTLLIRSTAKLLRKPPRTN